MIYATLSSTLVVVRLYLEYTSGRVWEVFTDTGVICRGSSRLVVTAPSEPILLLPTPVPSVRVTLRLSVSKRVRGTVRPRGPLDNGLKSGLLKRHGVLVAGSVVVPGSSRRRPILESCREKRLRRSSL